MSFWCVTTFFNPAGYASIVNNYHVFAAAARQQNIPLFTIELGFGNRFYLPKGTLRLHGNSVMWQKERLINVALSCLPDSCDAVAWVDCDILFANQDWAKDTQDLLSRYDAIQLFKRVFHLPQGETSYQGRHTLSYAGIAYQRAMNDNWLKRRENKELPYAAPGFAWAARRSAFPKGIYDCDVVGSGDCVLVDQMFNCWNLHGHHHKFNTNTKSHIAKWGAELKNLHVHYLDSDVFHLWHGNLGNRKYMHRHSALLDNDYNPEVDIKLVDGVYEWATDKKDMHRKITDYFFQRQDDC